MEKETALKILRERHAKALFSERTALETLIPELAESEAEWIRRELIDFVDINILSIDERHDRWIAWLEKQGEKESDPRYENLEEILAADDIYQMSMNDEMVQEAKEKAVNALSGMCIGRLLGLEKQGKQKSIKNIMNVWKDMRLEVYQQASGNRNEPNYSDDTTKMFSLNDIDEIIEKMSEQKPVNNPEPKFKVGDWVVQGRNILKIKCVGHTYYCFETVGGYVADMFVSEIDSLYHLWTIQDAKDGDIIANGDMVLIFKCFEEPSYRQHIIAYIGLDTCGNIQVTDEYWMLGIDGAKPATKKQRDFLLQKMKEAGYKWDAVKKELNKIEQ